MKKLSSLFAVAALAATICAAGCKKKGDGDSAPKTDEAAKPDDKMAKPDDKMAKPDDKAAAAAAPGEIPSECADYKAAVTKLASCDKMPQQTRDALKASYDTMSAGWAQASNASPDVKKAMATGCKTSADSLMTTAKAVCGW
jgi:hypothetical protein